jgi:2'-5' RNA ligase
LKRLFFGVSPQAGLRRALAAAANAAQGRWAGGSLRWIPPADYHLTLVFLGAVAQERVGDALAAARAGLQGASPCGAALGSIQWFPDARRPRVLAVMLEGDRELFQLHRQLVEALGAHGFAPGRRPLRPHITLARPVGRGPCPEPAARLAWPGGETHLPIARVRLFASGPGGTVPRYRSIADFELAAPGVPGGWR